MASLGQGREAEIITSLGADVLLLTGFRGREELGRLSDYTVNALSLRGDISADELLGKNVTVRVKCGAAQRYFNGFVTSLSLVNVSTNASFKGRRMYSYTLQFQPWLWMLTRSSDCRAFQDLSTPKVVERTLSTYGGKVESVASGTYEPHAYCVQYRETDFNFVSRLWESAGLYYYFAHANGSHTLKIADHPSGHKTSTLAPYLDFRRSDKSDQVIDEFVATGSLRPGKYAARDFSFQHSRMTVEGVHAKAASHPFGDLDIFDYAGGPSELPGGKAPGAEATRLATVRMEEMVARRKSYRGSGGARGVEVGCLFKLRGHFAPALDQEYLVVAHDFQMRMDDYESNSGEVSFSMQFTAVPSSVQFRPERLTPEPHISGPQTAFVTGPSGEEVYTDKFGRVRVQFHWDRYAGSQSDSNSAETSCWVRVAHPWAGKGWGMLALPRVGQEVIVDFLEGDPDRPIVTNRVFNDISTVPYALPANKSQMTIKSSTIGGGGFNELRFDDKAGSEQVFMHAQKQLDLRVLKDRFEFIGATDQRMVKEDLVDEVGGDAHLKVTGDQNVKIAGTASLDAGADWQVKVAQKSAVDSGQEIHFKAGMKVIIEAGTQISLKVGGNFINISPAGIDIQGTLTKVNSGGSAGSGSGASPDAPKAPKEAASGKAGEKDAAATKPSPPAAKKYSPAAVALKSAAAGGAPFVGAAGS
jgi:type VI secretion system secreted protein VgrG